MKSDAITLGMPERIQAGKVEHMQPVLPPKIAEVSDPLAASRRFLDLPEQRKQTLARAPQDGLNEVEDGAGNENRTRN
ncbi:hypothetical protein [Sulfitobacter sp. THAF37]|uniref:hypothetical protein n=1 Tax=Sulfitobacter sp. THAF37 TaxID=2587855 RepID=UPI001267C39E|nr:hypothetical protein [Sulfitobacter sp. THAF37]